MRGLAFIPLFLLLFAGEGIAQGEEECFLGRFEAPFNHLNGGTNKFPTWSGTFRTAHMTLIPTGPYQGRVLVWDNGPPNNFDTTYWSIVNPEAPQSDLTKYQNFVLSHPTNSGNLFCGDGAWTKHGRFFVAGGVTTFSSNCSVGSKLAYLFDPNQSLGNGMWIQQTAGGGGLAVKRYYPTVAWIAPTTAFPNGQIAVLGDNQAANVNNYEVFNAPASTETQGTWDTDSSGSRLFPGPTFTNGDKLGFYPYTLLLSNSDLFTPLGVWVQPNCSQSVMTVTSMVRHHLSKGVWTKRGDVGQNRGRIYGSAVLLPNTSPTYQNAVMLLGGTAGSQAAPTDDVQYCKASKGSSGCFPSGYDWSGTGSCTALPKMIHKRKYPNAVLLPDASVVVFGGVSAEPNPPDYTKCNQFTYVYQAERYTLGGTWQPLATAASRRGYHSVALLLPSGKVLVASGECRDWDYEIYVPPYLACDDEQPRPTWQNPKPGPVLSYQSLYTAYFDLGGAEVQKVVLMRPGSVTHHFDTDQRYVELEIQEEGQNHIMFFTPPSPPSAAAPTDSNAAPEGWYMMFLVTNAGVPSVAHWVNLQ